MKYSPLHNPGCGSEESRAHTKRCNQVGDWTEMRRQRRRVGVWGVRLGVEWEVLWAGYLCISSGGAYPAKIGRKHYEHAVPIGRAGNGVVAESRLVEQHLGRRKTGLR